MQHQHPYKCDERVWAEAQNNHQGRSTKRKDHKADEQCQFKPEEGMTVVKGTDGGKRRARTGQAETEKERKSPSWQLEDSGLTLLEEDEGPLSCDPTSVECCGMRVSQGPDRGPIAGRRPHRRQTVRKPAGNNANS